MNSRYVSYLKAKKSSEGTIEQYTKTVKEFLEYINKPENDIVEIDVLDWQGSIAHLASATICQKYAAVKSYFKFLKGYGFIEHNPTLEMERPKVNSKPKHYMSAEMVSAMVNNCLHIRDKAVILTMASTGMRISELTSITVKQWEDMLTRKTNYITIVGKGAKKRNVYFNQQTINAVNEYLYNRYTKSQWLFASNEGNQIARNNMSNMLKATARRAGIEFADDMCNHQMRSAFCTIAAENGVNIGVIRDMMGHAQLSTTSKYLKTTEDKMQSASMGMVF